MACSWFPKRVHGSWYVQDRVQILNKTFCLSLCGFDVTFIADCYTLIVIVQVVLRTNVLYIRKLFHSYFFFTSHHVYTLAYEYKLVDAGRLISGSGPRAAVMLSNDKLIFWYIGISFDDVSSPVVSVNEYISLFEMYIWLVDVVCNVQKLIKERKEKKKKQINKIYSGC